MSQAYYRNDLSTFLSESPESIKIKLDDGSIQFTQVWTVQFTSWYSSIDILKNQLSQICDKIPEANGWTILFEYEIPRLLSRIDIVLLASDLIFVIEFKLDRKTFEFADVRQVEDYALDLKDFHLQSRDRIIVPVLLAPLAKNIIQEVVIDYEKQIQATIKANKDNLAELIIRCFNTSRNDSLSINAKEWENSIYSPTPTIIQAAQALFAGQRVEAITKVGAENLTLTTDYLLSIIADAKRNKNKVVCFVTGVPGAGKTLVGLNAIHREDAVEVEKSHKAYFSGNGPLVKVLTEALMRDEYERAKNRPLDGGSLVNKSAIRQKLVSKIQNLHNFIKSNINKSLAPIEQIVVFDEAQRCWDAANFYNKAIQSRPGTRKEGDPEPVRKSEAEIIFEVMDRHEEWAVIVALIGSGQEINTGEAGIGEWGRVLAEKFRNWHIHVSPKLLGNADKSVGVLFDETPRSLLIKTSDCLHLAVSQRSFKASNLNEWVNAVIDNDFETARKLYNQIEDRYPIYITRNLDAAKLWLRQLRQGNKRIGLVASSGGLRLRPYGINTREEIDVPYWFLNDEYDVRSSNYLEIVATEYKIQGLEIDWSCVCWDADLRRGDDKWEYKNFTGTSWYNVNSGEDQQFLLNKYRVLLTRAREGMVIWVPPGNAEDRTRLPEIYDPIYDYLLACGIKKLQSSTLTKT